MPQRLGRRPAEACGKRYTMNLRFRQWGSDGNNSGDTPGWVNRRLLLQSNAGTCPDFFAVPEGAVSLSESRTL